LLLRNWQEEDGDSFLDVYGRDEVARWLGAHPRRAVQTRVEAVDRIRRWGTFEEGLTPPLGLWAMVPRHPERSRPVGTVLLLPLADESGPSDEVEIGWHLHPDMQGRGLVTEAATALLAAAAAAGVDSVLAVTDLDNLPSQAVARRLGMRDEGVTDRWFGITAKQYRTP
jgi:RimJ/RimL family protein N-acetyltransferase